MSRSFVVRVLLCGALLSIGALPNTTAFAAGFFVGCSNGMGNVNALNKAIISANAAGGGTIDLAAKCTYTLTSPYLGPTGLPPITSPIQLNGHGSSIVRQSSQNFRILRIHLSAPALTTTISDLTISGGLAAGTNDGGGILLQMGTLDLEQVTVSSNQSLKNGGGIAVGRGGIAAINDSTIASNAAVVDGGGIWNTGRLTVHGSTLSGNFAQTGNGGGIDNTTRGTAMISSSTLAANGANLGGGMFDDGTATLVYSTVAGNRTLAGLNGGGLAFIPPQKPSLFGSIVANNRDGNCTGGVQDEGYNLEDDPPTILSCFSFVSSIIGQNPLLGPLTNNGGPTSTMGLMAGSPALNIIPSTPVYSCDGSSLDQRGVARPQPATGMCDMGAVEVVATTTLLQAPASAGRGQPVQLTATVSPSTTRTGQPTGSVTFSAVSPDGGTSRILAVVPIGGSHRQVATTTVRLTAGAHRLVAAYSPEQAPAVANFMPSTSVEIVITVS